MLRPAQRMNHLELSDQIRIVPDHNRLLQVRCGTDCEINIPTSKTMLRNFFLNMEPPLDPPLKCTLCVDVGKSVCQSMLIIAQTSQTTFPDNFNAKFG